MTSYGLCLYVNRVVINLQLGKSLSSDTLSPLDLSLFAYWAVLFQKCNSKLNSIPKFPLALIFFLKWSLLDLTCISRIVWKPISASHGSRISRITPLIFFLIYSPLNHFILFFAGWIFYFIFYFSFIFISWRLITLQYCSGFCHTLTWISHGFTCIPHPDPPSHVPLHPIPLGLPSGALNHFSMAGLTRPWAFSLCSDLTLSL